MQIIHAAEFDAYWKERSFSALNSAADASVDAGVRSIIAEVRRGGDDAVRRYASQFDRSSPEKLEVDRGVLKEAWEELAASEPDLAGALQLSADHLRRFAEKQREPFADFECEISSGLFAGQRVIPVQRAAIYVPAGRFPLVSTVLMGAIPALAAGVEEVLVASAPLEEGLPDRRIMAAAHLAGVSRVFAIGGAQAIAALALGTETVPRADLVAGPGNKHVAAAKRILFGEVGIDFVAGPTDVLVIAGEAASADLVAADMLAQAEHDGDARARALVPGRSMADGVAAALEKRLAVLPTADTARSSLDAGGLLIIYETRDEAVRVANAIAPEHLELQVSDPPAWLPSLRNYGSIFIGELAAEVLGDYSAGINHTLPTSGGARFSGGLSVRHFLKIVTSLRCAPGQGFEKARSAAERIARAEGLAAHEESAASRRA